MTTESKPKRAPRRRRGPVQYPEVKPKAAAAEEPAVEGEYAEGGDVDPTKVDPNTIVGESGPEQVNLPAVVAQFDPGTTALSILSDEEFETRLLQMRKGRERVVRILQELLVVDVDYGIIPGTDDRHTLFKAGAEKLCQFYGLVSRIVVTPRIGDNVTAPAVRYDAECFIHLGSTEGPIVATGYGTANSWEKRYLRPAIPCPLCEAPALMKSKYGPGFYCNPKAGGCGGNVPASEVPPSDPKGTVTTAHDLGNTLAKMAEKRGHVDATLRATATSGLFTQDVVEDENSDTRLGPNTTVDETPHETVTPGGATVDAETGEVKGRTVDMTGNPDEDHAAAGEVPVEQLPAGLEELAAVTPEEQANAERLNELAAAGNATDPKTGKVDVEKVLGQPDPLAEDEPEVRPSSVPNVGRGGSTPGANGPQIAQVKSWSKALRLGPHGLADEIAQVFQGGIDATMLPEDKRAAATQLEEFLGGMSSGDIGKLISHLKKQHEEDS